MFSILPKRLFFQKQKFLLFLIILLALFLRLYKLTDIPYGFFCDEAANGFNAYKIASSGRDEYGVLLPFYFRSLGDYRNPVAIYSMIPAIIIFGLNEFSVRLTMVIYGTATIITIFLFTKELFWKEPKINRDILSLASALFLAISPWHIHFSRSGFEFIPLPFFLTTALFFLFRFIHIIESDNTIYLNKQTKFSLWLSSIFFTITFYTYYPIQLVLIPFLSGIIIIYRKVLFNKKTALNTIIALSIFVIGLSPFVNGILSKKALTRFQSVSPFSRTSDYKKLVPSLIKLYRDHFSLDFLFLKGDISLTGHFITRHSVKNKGELYLFQLPLLLVGLVTLGFKYPQTISLFLLWFLLYPIGSTVTAEGPLAHRSIFGVIPFQILSGYGLAVLFTIIDKTIKKVRSYQNLIKITFGVGLFLIFLLSLRGYTDEYFKKYPLYSSDFWGWQYGPRDIMNYFLKVKDSYDDLYMSGEYNGSEIFLKFFDPENLCQNKCKGGDFWRVPQIYNPVRRQLFSLSPEYLNNSSLKSNFVIKKTLYYPDGKIAFLIGEVFPPVFR